MKKPSASANVAVEPIDEQAQKREAVLRRLHERFAHIAAGVSLADELISERRAEAGRRE